MNNEHDNSLNIIEKLVLELIEANKRVAHLEEENRTLTIERSIAYQVLDRFTVLNRKGDI